MAELLTEVSGRSVKYVDIGDTGLAEALKDAPEWRRESMLFLEKVKANGWAANVSPHVEAILGRPGEPYLDFLRRNVALLR